MPYNKTRKETRCAADARLKEGWSPYETLPVAAANDAQPVPGFHAVYLAVQIFISAFAAQNAFFKIEVLKGDDNAVHGKIMKNQKIQNGGQQKQI